MTSPRVQPTLRLTQTAEGESKYRVEIALDGIPGVPCQTAGARFSFILLLLEVMNHDNKSYH